MICIRAGELQENVLRGAGMRHVHGFGIMISPALKFQLNHLWAMELLNGSRRAGLIVARLCVAQWRE